MFGYRAPAIWHLSGRAFGGITRRVKKTSKCPKCGSTKIYRIEHDSIQPREFIEVGILRSIQIVRQICVECGYVEEWIDPPLRLKELVQKKRTDGLQDSE